MAGAPKLLPVTALICWLISLPEAGSAAEFYESAGNDYLLVRQRRATCGIYDCLNGGQCVTVTFNTKPPTTAPVCNCKLPYTAPKCELGDYCTLDQPELGIYSEKCLNGGTCTGTVLTAPYFTCNCAPGFTGTRCETNIDDCPGKICGNGQCVDSINSYSCSCYPGWEGSTCQINHDDCAPGVCQNGGKCSDGNRTYTCDCSGTGFSGTTCSLNIDDCAIASKPCANGQCVDLVRNYSCSCYTGWEGRDCSVDTDYCKATPCLNGGHCADGNSTFTCNCSTIDYSGPTCSSHINDCSPNPCLNGGLCSDGVRSFTCDCSNIDFNGTNCSRKIDDCSPSPCANGATCVDGVRNYSCSCYAGYSGKNCSDDTLDCIANRCDYGGTCLERSNPSLYTNLSLPPPFNSSFNYSLAAGFVCLCVPGSFGPTCSVNPNDCLIAGTNQSVCVHASGCTDGLANYTCQCLPGYDNKNCSHDIDECQVFGQPCLNNASCTDLVADYVCNNCPAAYGGKNCSLALIGCQPSPCQNAAQCVPILVSEIPKPAHDYRCICTAGWSDRNCSTSTVVSLNGWSSVVAVLGNSSSLGDWTLEVTFRSSLTQFDLMRVSSDWGVIRVGAFNASVSVQLVNASSSNASQAVIGQVSWSVANSLVNADWLTLSIGLTNGSASLKPIGSAIGVVAKLEGLSASFRRSPMSVQVGHFADKVYGTSFRGCVQDLRLVTPSWTSAAVKVSTKSDNASWGGCDRSPQCVGPSSCQVNSSSSCTDLWNDFLCTCLPDYGGRICSVQLPSFTFGLDGNASSATFASLPAASNAYGSDDLWSVEMKLLTLSPGAFVMMLGDPSNSTVTPRMLVSILPSGQLSAQLLLSNSSVIAHLDSAVSVATGSFVAVKVSLSISRRLMSLTASSSVSSASFSNVSSLAQPMGQLIIGGFAGVAAAPAPSLVVSGVSRSKRSAPALSSSVVSALAVTGSVTGFRGIVSSPRLNEAKPLILGGVSSSLIDSLPGALSASDSTGVLVGAVSETVCKTYSPCQNGATCTDVFYNKYSCRCASGWRGVTCTLRDACATGTGLCPAGTECANLEPVGFECRTAATFGSSLQSSPVNLLLLSVSGLSESLATVTGWARTRHSDSKLVTVTSGDRQLSIKSSSGQLQASLDDQTASVSVGIATGVPFTFSVGCSASSPLTLRVSVNGSDVITGSSSMPIAVGVPLNSLSVVSLGDAKFKGCLDNVRINNYLAPLVNRPLVDAAAGFLWSVRGANLSSGPTAGCYGDAVCAVGSDGGSVCKNSGKCTDLWNEFKCDCQQGYLGATCVDIDAALTSGAIAGIVIAIILVAGTVVAAVLVTRTVQSQRRYKGIYAPEAEEAAETNFRRAGLIPPLEERLF